MKVQGARLVLGVGGLLAAGALVYLATRSAGPVSLSQYTELRTGPLQEHLVTKEELGLIPATPRMRYPARVAPALNQCIHQGFTPQFQIPDPMAAALPAEQAW